MKDIYYFILWLIKKVDIVKFIFITAILADIASLFFPAKSSISKVLVLYGLGTPFLLSLKYLIYDSIEMLWKKYQKEKANLFNMLKSDD